MHTLFEIYRIERTDFVATFLKHFSALDKDSPFRIGHAVACRHLHKIWFYKKPCFSATAAADYKHILVSCEFWIFRAAVHCQPFRVRQQNIIVKILVNVRLNILRRAPACRAVFNTFSEFLCVFAPQIQNALDRKRTNGAY